MGHTADDLLEAEAMRAAGSSTPSPREWAPSPAWPEGRGVFLLRPMIRVRRQPLRKWLCARGETWIEDPANSDLTYARPRARQARAESAEGLDSPPPETPDLARACEDDGKGGLEIARPALSVADAEGRARFLAAACLCAAGTDRPPARTKIERLEARLACGEPFVATLAGARIEAGPDRVRFRREPGEAERGGLAPLSLAAGETGVWDGRFEVTADRAVIVTALRRTALPVAAGWRPTGGAAPGL